MKIIVPVDGSIHSREAVKLAADYAKAKNAKVCLISIVPYIEAVDLEITAGERERVKARMSKRAEAVIQEASAVLEKDKLSPACNLVVDSTSIPDTIVDYAEREKADLIIIGSRGLGPSSRLRLGSVASSVVTHSPCSVCVVKLPS